MAYLTADRECEKQIFNNLIRPNKMKIYNVYIKERAHNNKYLLLYFLFFFMLKVKIEFKALEKEQNSYISSNAVFINRDLNLYSVQ